MNNSIATMQCMPNIDALFNIIRGIIGEIHPHWKHLLFTPDTHLERDLGLNNLARLELCARIEKEFNITLDKTSSINASTPLDLMHFILKQTGLQHAAEDKEKTTVGDKYTFDNISGSLAARETVNDSTETHHTNEGRWFYTIYAWSIFLILGLAALILMVITPFEQWRQNIARASTRFLFKCTLISLHVSGKNYLDAGRPKVVVANHTSYLDGFIITAALGIPLHFIVKAELSRIPIICLILKRFGVEFIDRFNASRGTKAIWRITRKSKNGHTLVFFPEGTFTSFSGLQPFRMGAFVTATRTSVPVIPVTIRGARKILRGNNWLIRRGNIDVSIFPPIMPDGDGWQNAVKLRDAVRREISENCGELDLAEYDTCAGKSSRANNPPA